MHKFLIVLIAPFMFFCAPTFADFPEQNVGECADHQPTPRREETREDTARRHRATALRELAQNDELDARLIRIPLPGACRADVGQQRQERLDRAWSPAFFRLLGDAFTSVDLLP